MDWDTRKSRLGSGDRTSLCFVCRQISAELLPFFAANTKFHLDGYTSGDHIGFAHTAVVPRWYASLVQEVVSCGTEIDWSCLSFFPSLKRAKLYKLEYEPLPISGHALRWTKADVEEEAVIKAVGHEAIGFFSAERHATNGSIPHRAFRPMLVGALVSGNRSACHVYNH